MKILLINPPFTRYERKVEVQSEEPLGIMYLAAYAREHGFKVELLDAFLGRESIYEGGGFYKSGMNDAELKAAIEKIGPDIVGISCMFTMHSKGSHDAAKVIKSISKDILVFMGGSHPSAMIEWVLADKNVDFVMKGEGEATFVELLQRLDQGKDYQDLKGIAYRDSSGKIVENCARPFIEDLNSIPLPARDLVDMSAYLKDPYRVSMAMRPPRANLVTSRGCPYTCNYCSIHAVWKNTWRKRSPKLVVDELEMLVREYGVGEVAFQDDNLTLDKRRMHELCDEMLRRKVDVKWCTPNGVSIWTLDPPVLDKMKASGCYKLTFGLETGSLKTLKFIRKEQQNLEKAKEIIAYCNKIGIWTHSPFIIGFPYEEAQDIEETIRYSETCGLDMAAFFIATPFPATDLYSIYKAEGLLPKFEDPTHLEWTGSQQYVMCDTKKFKQDELRALVASAMGRFYKARAKRFIANPGEIFPKLTNWHEVRYFLKLIGASVGMFKHFAFSAPVHQGKKEPIVTAKGPADSSLLASPALHVSVKDGDK